MRPTALRALTWATVAAAVASALWLALVEVEMGVPWRITALPPGMVATAGPGERVAMGDAPRRRGELHHGAQ